MKDDEIKKLEQWGQTPSYYTIAKNRLKSVWKYFVRTAAVLSVILTSVIVYLTYMDYLDEQLMERSPLIQEIRKMEADERNNEIWVKLVNEINNVPDHDEDLVIKWLKQRLSDGTAPYYYVLSLYYLKKANREGSKDIATKGVEYYSAGHLIYRIDALRCDDPASGQVVSDLESTLFGTTIDEIFSKDREVKVSSVTWALRQEEKIRHRAPSAWICKQGIKKWTESGELSPGEQWQMNRLRFRNQYIESMLKTTEAG